MNTKYNVRKQLLFTRNKLSSQQVKNLSASVCEVILHHEIYHQAQNIALYYATKNEVNLSSILNQQDKKHYLPVVHDGYAMTFNHYLPNTQISCNKYGIFEPINTNTISANNINLCLIPLVGFNRKGDRLGMGGGFYDRYFALNKLQKTPTILAGVAYDFQESDTIKTEAWDIPLDYIFTNKEVIKP